MCGSQQLIEKDKQKKINIEKTENEQKTESQINITEGTAFQEQQTDPQQVPPLEKMIVDSNQKVSPTMPEKDLIKSPVSFGKAMGALQRCRVEVAKRIKDSYVLDQQSQDKYRIVNDKAIYQLRSKDEWEKHKNDAAEYDYDPTTLSERGLLLRFQQEFSLDYIPKSEELARIRQSIIEEALGNHPEISREEYEQSIDAKSGEYTGNTFLLFDKLEIEQKVRLLQEAMQYIAICSEANKRFEETVPYRKKFQGEAHVRGNKFYYPQQGYNNCYGCAGSAVFNFEVNEKEEENKLDQYKVRSFIPKFMTNEELTRQAHGNPVEGDNDKQNIELFCGKKKTKYGNFFAVSDVIFDEKKNGGLDRKDVAVHSMTFMLKGVSDKMKHNLVEAMKKKMYDILSEGHLVAVSRQSHYLTVTGIDGDKVYYLDSMDPGEIKKPKSQPIEKFLKGPGKDFNTTELNWVTKIDENSYEKLSKEYPDMQLDEETGQVKRGTDTVVQDDVAHRAGIVIVKDKKERSEEGLDDVLENVTEMICVRRDAFAKAARKEEREDEEKQKEEKKDEEKQEEEKKDEEKQEEEKKDEEKQEEEKKDEKKQEEEKKDEKKQEEEKKDEGKKAEEKKDEEKKEEEKKDEKKKAKRSAKRIIDIEDIKFSLNKVDTGGHSKEYKAFMSDLIKLEDLLKKIDGKETEDGMNLSVDNLLEMRFYYKRIINSINVYLKDKNLNHSKKEYRMRYQIVRALLQMMTADSERIGNLSIEKSCILADALGDEIADKEEKSTAEIVEQKDRRNTALTILKGELAARELQVRETGKEDRPLEADSEAALIEQLSDLQVTNYLFGRGRKKGAKVPALESITVMSERMALRILTMSRRKLYFKIGGMISEKDKIAVLKRLNRLKQEVIQARTEGKKKGLRILKQEEFDDISIDDLARADVDGNTPFTEYRPKIEIKNRTTAGRDDRPRRLICEEQKIVLEPKKKLSNPQEGLPFMREVFGASAEFDEKIGSLFNKLSADRNYGYRSKESKEDPFDTAYKEEFAKERAELFSNDNEQAKLLGMKSIADAFYIDGKRASEVLASKVDKYVNAMKETGKKGDMSKEWSNENDAGLRDMAFKAILMTYVRNGKYQVSIANYQMSRDGLMEPIVTDLNVVGLADNAKTMDKRRQDRQSRFDAIRKDMEVKRRAAKAQDDKELVGRVNISQVNQFFFDDAKVFLNEKDEDRSDEFVEVKRALINLCRAGKDQKEGSLIRKIAEGEKIDWTPQSYRGYMRLMEALTNYTVTHLEAKSTKGKDRLIAAQGLQKQLQLIAKKDLGNPDQEPNPFTNVTKNEKSFAEENVNRMIDYYRHYSVRVGSDPIASTDEKLQRRWDILKSAERDILIFMHKHGDKLSEEQRFLISEYQMIRRQITLRDKLSEREGMQESLMNDRTNRLRNRVLRQMGIKNEEKHEHSVDGLTVDQLEGVRQIDHWVLRNFRNGGYMTFGKNTTDRSDIMARLMSMTQRQRLYIYYIIQHPIARKVPKNEDAVLSQIDFVPDLSKFKKQMIASKAKFYTRYSGGYVYWNKMSQAMAICENGSPLLDTVDRFFRNKKDLLSGIEEEDQKEERKDDQKEERKDDQKEERKEGQKEEWKENQKENQKDKKSDHKSDDEKFKATQKDHEKELNNLLVQIIRLKNKAAIIEKGDPNNGREELEKEFEKLKPKIMGTVQNLVGEINAEDRDSIEKKSKGTGAENSTRIVTEYGGELAKFVNYAKITTGITGVIGNELVAKLGDVLGDVDTGISAIGNTIGILFSAVTLYDNWQQLVDADKGIQTSKLILSLAKTAKTFTSVAKALGSKSSLITAFASVWANGTLSFVDLMIASAIVTNNYFKNQDRGIGIGISKNIRLKEQLKAIESGKEEEHYLEGLERLNKLLYKKGASENASVFAGAAFSIGISVILAVGLSSALTGGLTGILSLGILGNLTGAKIRQSNIARQQRQELVSSFFDLDKMMAEAEKDWRRDHDGEHMSEKQKAELRERMLYRISGELGYYSPSQLSAELGKGYGTFLLAGLKGSRTQRVMCKEIISGLGLDVVVNKDTGEVEAPKAADIAKKLTS